MHEKFSVREAAAELDVHVSTCYQYLRGVTVNGRRVRLRGEAVGSRWRVPAAAIDEFRAACTAAAHGDAPPPQQTAPRSRDILTEAGI